MEKKKNQELWIDKDKKVISCDETNKVLNENLVEIKSLLQNTFDDATLLNCDEHDFKEKLINYIKNIEFSLGKKKN